ncbi:MAG TPA: rhomboid family intramembrane serine protease, partial [Deinococcales bacterium]|nr:rhomboid family intramembrane serine protease [Deinococcales bacterium]
MGSTLLVILVVAVVGVWLLSSGRARRDPALEADLASAAERGDPAAARSALRRLGWRPGGWRWNVWLGRALMREAELTGDAVRLQEGGDLLLRGLQAMPPNTEGERLRATAATWLAPYGVQAPAARRAATAGPGTVGVLLALLAYFAVEVYLNGPDLTRGLGVGGIDPYVTAILGSTGRVLSIEAGEYWRLLAAVLLHGGLMHLAFNSYALWIFGAEVESRAGWGLLLLVFVLGGLGGSLASSFLGDPRSTSVGASGAVFALLGFAAVFGAHGLQARYAQLQRALPTLLLIFVVNGLIIPNVDNWGHGGGLVTGVLLGLLLH